ncbi:MAG: DUF4038 domain-containing protein [Tannerella sp.]|jgi:hypothetical protein|nr:DUF4038 domain-containing protein [Tannerella sp.]
MMKEKILVLLLPAKSKRMIICIQCMYLFLVSCGGRDRRYEDVPPGSADVIVPVWHCAELVFHAGKTYDRPLTGEAQCEMDAVFTHDDGTEIRRPAFWNGGDTFIIRFAPTRTGRWTYTTACADDPALDGLRGTVGSNRYTGELAIYRHGFLKVSDNRRYFTYDDGTPFFYLGDTHWSMPFEAFASSGVPGVASQFRHIVDTRIRQGFTVYQSEPIQWANATGQDRIYDLTAFDAGDLDGFANLDRKFRYLADRGMLHANAQLFFADELAGKKDAYSGEYLEKLARYWVARYGAWPVLWTCAQECDNDFYFDREGNQKAFDAGTNPWKTVLEALHRYDAYHHPLSAHMEYASGTAPEDGHGTIASNSSFKYLDGHNWYACQWSPAKKEQFDFRVPENFWNSDVTKPTVNYEGHYDHFWTNTFGARMQGWTAFLNGMAGYGYGAAGIWLIINRYPDDLAGAYDLDRDTDSELTREVKRMTWDRALLLPAAEQLGIHMRRFLESMEWWKLTPRFGDPQWGSFPGAFYALATLDSDAYVCYFYHPDRTTGHFRQMHSEKTYTARWYDPETGEYRDIGAVKPDSSGVWEIPPKPDERDWVLSCVLEQ